MPNAKAYRIETERLVIRCYHPKDAPLLKASIDESLEHLRPWMPWTNDEPESIDKKTARLRKYRGQFDLGIDYTFGIFNKEEDTLIGSTGLHTGADENAREIGYWLNVNHIGKGYALETVKALTTVGFEIEGLERIEIHCASNNMRSRNVPEKAGYINEAILRGRHLDPFGEKRDVMIWTMFKGDYLNITSIFEEVKAFNLIGERL
jgi:RimJ/RimL family protein N-acetyltransferase